MLWRSNHLPDIFHEMGSLTVQVLGIQEVSGSGEDDDSIAHLRVLHLVHCPAKAHIRIRKVQYNSRVCTCMFPVHLGR